MELENFSTESNCFLASFGGQGCRFFQNGNESHNFFLQKNAHIPMYMFLHNQTSLFYRQRLNDVLEVTHGKSVFDNWLLIQQQMIKEYMVLPEYMKKRKGALPRISVKHFKRKNCSFRLLHKSQNSFISSSCKTKTLPQYGKYLEFDSVYNSFLKC